MNWSIKKVNGVDEVANLVASSVLRNLQQGKPVLLFVTGGSSILVGVRVAELLQGKDLENLTVTLTDERYGEFGHSDSNWQQLIGKGFSLPSAKLVPVLAGENEAMTVEKFNTILEEELAKDSYKLGLFGIGLDGHTAGILPESPALNSTDFACYYASEKFKRITITEKVIERLDEGVVVTKGEEKLKVLEIMASEIDKNIQPAQMLKKIPLLTIFNDVNK